MSTKDPLDSFQDPDRTILVPVPGGKRAQSRAPADSLSSGSDPIAAPVHVPATAQHNQDSPSFARQAGSTGSLAARDPVLQGHGLNRLVAAANPLLELALVLRNMVASPNVENLRQQLIEAIKTFEQQAKLALVDHDAIAVARFSLCTFLDETISATPWGGGGVWASRSLLVTFHNEASGGEKFFLLLQKLCQDPALHVDTIELMYLCLTLGLEGRYRIIENGRSQLDIVRERLQQVIQKQRGDFEPALSLHWQGAVGKGEPLWRVIPVWILALIALVVLVLLQLILSWSLTRASDPVFESMYKINIDTAPPIVASVQAPVVAAPVRVAPFLVNEIERGLVSVVESADRSTITLRGDGVFASGSAEIAGDFIPLIERIGDALKTVQGKVVVVGHTDNTKGMSVKFPSNWDLSKGRASAVRKLLAERAGPSERYSVEGRGDLEPVVPNDSAINRARNRRVDIILLTPAVN